jgi:hypothetical protein
MNEEEEIDSDELEFFDGLELPAVERSGAGELEILDEDWDLEISWAGEGP